jgi:hypothetical protein
MLSKMPSGTAGFPIPARRDCGSLEIDFLNGIYHRGGAETRSLQEEGDLNTEGRSAQ